MAHQARVLGALDETAFEKTVAEARDAVSRAVGTVVRARIIDHERQPYKAAIAEGGTVDDLAALAASGYRAGVIYADPPWSFAVYGERGTGRSADRHYDTMSLGDIVAMGAVVRSLAADNCALVLWVYGPLLFEAKSVIEAWGFTYKAHLFTWEKTVLDDDDRLVMGLGYWTRADSEICLLATRGSPKRLAKDVHQGLRAPRGAHSAKPEEFRCRIERLLPGPYLELFAREQAPGWMVWGSQVPMA